MKTANTLVIALMTALMTALVATGAARAQDDYPNRPIRLIAPVTAGSEPVGSLPEEFAALIRAHDKREGDIVKSLGLKPE